MLSVIFISGMERDRLPTGAIYRHIRKSKEVVDRSSVEGFKNGEAGKKRVKR